MGGQRTKALPGIPEPSPAGQVPPTHRTTILPHGNPGAKFLFGRPQRRPQPPGIRLEENPPLTTVAAHLGASPAEAGGAPDIPPTKLESLCARSAKKSRRRHFSSESLGRGLRRCPWGSARAGLRRPVLGSHVTLRGRPCPQPSSLRAAFVNEAGMLVLGSNVCASGSPVPRRRTLVAAIHGLHSLGPACASPSGAALVGYAGSRSTADPSLALSSVAHGASLQCTGEVGIGESLKSRCRHARWSNSTELM